MIYIDLLLMCSSFHIWYVFKFHKRLSSHCYQTGKGLRKRFFLPHFLACSVSSEIQHVWTFAGVTWKLDWAAAAIGRAPFFCLGRYLNLAMVSILGRRLSQFLPQKVPGNRRWGGGEVSLKKCRISRIFSDFAVLMAGSDLMASLARYRGELRWSAESTNEIAPGLQFVILILNPPPPQLGAVSLDWAYDRLEWEPFWIWFLGCSVDRGIINKR